MVYFVSDLFAGLVNAPNVQFKLNVPARNFRDHGFFCFSSTEQTNRKFGPINVKGQ